jgi:hypothetical protein
MSRRVPQCINGRLSESPRIGLLSDDLAQLDVVQLRKPGIDDLSRFGRERAGEDAVLDELLHVSAFEHLVNLGVRGFRERLPSGQHVTEVRGKAEQVAVGQARPLLSPGYYGGQGVGE